MWEVNRKPDNSEKLLELEKLELLLEDAESYRDLPDWMVYPELLEQKMLQRIKLRKDIRLLKKELNMDVI